MCKAILKLSVKEMLWMHKPFCKNADKLSTAVVMLLAWKIKLANSFSKCNYKDLGNITKNFKVHYKLRDWNLRMREGWETLKAALPIKAE